MKLKRLLGALLLIAILTLWPILLVHFNAIYPGKLGFFPMLLLAWALVTIASLAVLILRYVRHYFRPTSFLNIFLALANFALAIYGFVEIFSSTSQSVLYFAPVLLAGNLAIAFVLGSNFFTS